jgi:multiple sugar transport system substrate-binding protein
MLKKGVALPITGLLLAAALTACGTASQKAGTDNTPAPKDPPKAAEPQKLKDPITLVVADGLGDWPEDRFNRVIAEPVKKKFPHITLKWAKNTDIKNNVTTGQPLDLVMSSSGLMQARVLDFDLQIDITPYLKQFNYDINQVEPTAVDIFRNAANGQLWAIPAFMAPSPLYYNKDIFDKFGVEYPKDGMTWDQTFELAKRVTRVEGGETYHGLFLSFGHVIRRNQYSLDIVDMSKGTVTFNSDQWKTVFQKAAQFYMIPEMNMDSKKAALAYQREAFTKTRTAAMWLPVSTQHTEAELSGMNWDMATFPEYADKPGVGPQPYPTGFFVTSMSKHKEDAFQVSAFLASEEYQLEWVKKGEFLTALKSSKLRSSFGSETDFYKGKNIKAMLPEKYAAPSAITRYNSTAESQMSSAFTKIILNQADLNTALRQAEEAANKAIQELKAQGK